uniref:GATA-type domain-containing protein n=1 Tax=Panagrellus redivivus TaxID=6233 RepID=A0A7E4US90_PANRE
MFSLGGPSDIDVEKEKQRLLPNMFPNFAQFFGSFPPTPGMPNFRGNTPVTSTPTSIAAAAAASGVFPMFPPNFAPQYFAIMQQQNQLMQQFSKNAAMNESSSTSAGSESRSSSTDSASKKLQVDADGNIICPACEDKLPSDTKWEEHIEMEKANLRKFIESIKKQGAPSNSRCSESIVQMQRKRDADLNRIKSNQQKRLAWKSIGPLRSSRSSVDPAEGCRSASADKNYCKGCERQHEFLIVSPSLDEPRCLDCFRKYRRQTNFLPSSITDSPREEEPTPSSSRTTPTTPSSIWQHTVDELLSTYSTSSRKRHASPDQNSLSPSSTEEKRIKIEV